MTNNPFDWQTSCQKSNTNSDLLKKIEYLISMEEYEEARLFLDIYIPENDNPLKKSILMRLDRYIQDYDSELQDEIDCINRHLYDGTDPTEYHRLDKKLEYGSITFKERLHLYNFWSAYPRQKSHEYCLEMFNWIVENKGLCCSDLLKYIIDQIIDEEVACFYFVLGRSRGFLSEVKHTIEYYEGHFKPESIYIAKLEYEQCCKNKWLPEKYLLNNSTVRLRT
jgi:hypothetical protein